MRTKLIFRREFLMSHATTNSIPSSNFNESNEENSRYIFHFIEQGKRGKSTAHSFFIYLTSPKKGKKSGIFPILRARNGPKKATAMVAVVDF